VKLWLVRHAAPLIPPGVCYGRTDVPADPESTQEAARALAAALPDGLQLRCSPLQRCEQLASVLRGLRPDLALECDPRLAEMDFGEWEGRPWHELGETTLARWTSEFETHRPGGGESVQVFMARVAGAFEETRAAGREAAWITHAGVIRAVQLLASGQQRVREAADWPAGDLPFGSWRVIDY